jgi:hypothetical protein
MRKRAVPSHKVGGDQIADRIDDLEAYRLLTATSYELQHKSSVCWSNAASRALKTAAVVVKAAASALYRQSLRG